MEKINQSPAPSPLAIVGVKSDGFMFYRSEEDRLRVGSNHSILITWCMVEINQGPAPSPLANGGGKSDGFMFYCSEENRLRVGSNHSILIIRGVAPTGWHQSFFYQYLCIIHNLTIHHR